MVAQVAGYRCPGSGPGERYDTEHQPQLPVNQPADGEYGGCDHRRKQVEHFRHRNGFDKCDAEECDQGRREQGDVAPAEEPAIDAEDEG